MILSAACFDQMTVYYFCMIFVSRPFILLSILSSSVESGSGEEAPVLLSPPNIGTERCFTGTMNEPGSDTCVLVPSVFVCLCLYQPCAPLPHTPPPLCTFILGWFMVYCLLLSFKVAAKAVQTGPRGVVLQCTCQGNANVAAAATRAPCAKEKVQTAGLSCTLQRQWMKYTSSLTGDANQ